MVNSAIAVNRGTSPAAVPEPDLKEIEASLRLFVHPGGIGEVRVICEPGSHGYYFNYDEIPKVARIVARDSRTARGIYVVMNELGDSVRDREPLKKSRKLTKDRDISRRWFILIDFDPSSPDRGADSATGGEKRASFWLMDAVYEWLLDHGFPEPIMASSGNGFHLLYAIDLPNDESTNELIQAFLVTLSRRFGTAEVTIDTGVHNASRITKLYGTVARKGQHRPDRPHRLSKLSFVPDGPLQTVSRELIESVISSGTPLDDLPTEIDCGGNSPARHVRNYEPVREKFTLPAVANVGDRHHTLIRTAGAVRALGMSELEIEGVLRLVNQTRCGGAKTEDEITRIASDYAVKDVNLGLQALMTCADESQIEAAKYEQQFKNEFLAASKQLVEGGSISEISERIRRVIDQSPMVTTTFPTYTSRELVDSDFTHEYLIPGLLVKGQPCILAGPKKCLKSNIASDLTISLASGSEFLNEFSVNGPRRTAFISGESGEATTKETAIRQARTKPIFDLADCENAFWCFTLPKLGQPNSVKSLVDYVLKHQIEVLIIDPAYLAMPLGESASNLFVVGDMLSDLSKVISETGVTPILLHHTGKGKGEGKFSPTELESIAWAGFQEWTRQWILLNRRAAYNPERGGSHQLWMAVGGSAGHSALWGVDIEERTPENPGGRIWDVSVRRASDIRKQDAAKCEQVKGQKGQLQGDSGREKLLEVYRRFPQGETMNQLKKNAGWSGTTFGPINAELLENGLIEVCEITKNNKRMDGFRLKSLGQPGHDPDSPGCPSDGV